MTSLVPLGICVISHDKPSKRKSWSLRRKDGWIVGVSLEHYRCQRFIPKDSRALSISDTIEFCHQHLTQPSVTAEDRVLHWMQQLTLALQESPYSNSSEQLEAIQALQNALGKWFGDMTVGILGILKHSLKGFPICGNSRIHRYTLTSQSNQSNK